MGQEAQPGPQALQQGPHNASPFTPLHRLVKGTEAGANPQDVSPGQGPSVASTIIHMHVDMGHTEETRCGTHR